MNRLTATASQARPVMLETDPDIIARYLQDAAHFPGGHAVGVARPQDVDEVGAVVRGAARVLPVGAQSSLTGGATPAGDVVLSTERLNHVRSSGETVIAGAGVTLQRLQQELLDIGRWFPPVPTYLGATIGGAISTNAAGAATFKYGSVRDWVNALTVVLANGDVVRIERGRVFASDDRQFVLVTSDGDNHVLRVPDITMPDVPKRSAGYHAAAGMDVIDLFIGAEGTLAVVVEAELRTAPVPAAVCWALVPVTSEAAAIQVVADLRAERGLGVTAIEHLDRRSLDVVREDGIDRHLHIAITPETQVMLLVQIEMDDDESSLNRLSTLMARHGLADVTEVALPGNRRRADAFLALREAVPSGVNRRVGVAHAEDPRVHKTAADMIVPFARFEEMMCACRQLCARYHLDLAVWGHISDGNVHPNIIPRHYEDVVNGKTVLLTLAERVIAMGGCPLAEHGVGRNPVKQQMLEMLYGARGVEAMRKVKLSLDPDWKLAPGVLFQQTDA